ncbi:MAG: hypothetical protein ABW278_16180, partial [Steroidobacteraceae bacterium]
FSSDVFVSFGSQDAYTFFPTIYGGLISLLGTSPAAALLTFGGALAVICATWWLARGVSDHRSAWLAAGLVAALPTAYGSGGGFALVEAFVTPRAWAEALVLLGIGFQVRGHLLPVFGCLAVALLVHPVMAFPGAVVIALLAVSRISWRWQYIVLFGAAIVFAVVAALPLQRWQLDQQWSAVIGHGEYLYIHNWTLPDWTVVLRTACTLGFAAVVVPRARSVAVATLAAMAGLLLLSAVGADLLHLALIVQGQAWRVTWLVLAISIAFCPATIVACLAESLMLRCAGLLLAAAWIAGSNGLALLLTLCATFCALLGFAGLSRKAGAPLGRSVKYAVLLLVVCSLAVASLEAADELNEARSSTWQVVRTLASDGVAPACLLVLASYGVSRLHGNLNVLTGMVALSVFLLAATCSKAWQEWRNTYYTPAVRSAFAPWRQRIPPGSDVLWATRLLTHSDPSFVWLALDRPSYFSSIQGASALFSRDAAMEISRRLDTLPVALPIEHPRNMTITGDSLPQVSCSSVPVKYLISSAPVAMAEIVPAPADAPEPFRRLRLYICP